MKRSDAELAVYMAMLNTRRLSSSPSIRNDPYWPRWAAYIGFLSEPTDSRPWTIGDRVISSWARKIATEAVESVERSGSLPSYNGTVLEPSTTLQDAISVYKENFRQSRLHQEGRLL